MDVHSTNNDPNDLFFENPSHQIKNESLHDKKQAVVEDGAEGGVEDDNDEDDCAKDDGSGGGADDSVDDDSSGGGADDADDSVNESVDNSSGDGAGDDDNSSRDDGADHDGSMDDDSSLPEKPLVSASEDEKSETDDEDSTGPSALSDSSGHSDMVNAFNSEFKKAYDSQVVSAHMRNKDAVAAQAYVAAIRDHVNKKLNRHERTGKQTVVRRRAPTATIRVLSSSKRPQQKATPKTEPRYTFLSDDEGSDKSGSSLHSEVNTGVMPEPEAKQETTMSRVELTVQHEVKIRRLRQLRDIFNASPYFDLEDIENVTTEIRESEKFIENLLESLTESLRKVLRMQVVVKHREIIIEKAVNNNLLNHHEDTVFGTLVSKQVHLLKLVNQ